MPTLVVVFAPDMSSVVADAEFHTLREAYRFCDNYPGHHFSFDQIPYEKCQKLARGGTESHIEKPITREVQ